MSDAEKRDDIVVAHTPSARFGWLKKAYWKRHPRQLWAVVGLVAALLFFGYLAYITGFSVFENKKLNKYPHVCSTSLLTDANDALSNGKSEKLDTVAKTVKKQKKYQTDPNCLLVLVEYSLHTGDPATARTYLTPLKKVYTPSMGFSNELGDYAVQTPATLEAQITAMEKTVKDFKETPRSKIEPGATSR